MASFACRVTLSSRASSCRRAAFACASRSISRVYSLRIHSVNAAPASAISAATMPLVQIASSRTGASTSSSSILLITRQRVSLTGCTAASTRWPSRSTPRRTCSAPASASSSLTMPASPAGRRTELVSSLSCFSRPHSSTSSPSSHAT
jgi:hypothetical protein